MYVKITGVQGGTTYTLVADPQTFANVATENVYLVCDTTAGAVTINLPTVSALGNATNVKIHVSDLAPGNAGTNNITIACAQGDTINRGANYVLNQDGASTNIVVDGLTQWVADDEGN